MAAAKAKAKPHWAAVKGAPPPPPVPKEVATAFKADTPDRFVVTEAGRYCACFGPKAVTAAWGKRKWAVAGSFHLVYREPKGGDLCGIADVEKVCDARGEKVLAFTQHATYRWLTEIDLTTQAVNRLRIVRSPWDAKYLPNGRVVLVTSNETTLLHVNGDQTTTLSVVDRGGTRLFAPAGAGWVLVKGVGRGERTQWFALGLSADILHPNAVNVDPDPGGDPYEVDGRVFSQVGASKRFEATGLSAAQFDGEKLEKKRAAVLEKEKKNGYGFAPFDGALPELAPPLTKTADSCRLNLGSDNEWLMSSKIRGAGVAYVPRTGKPVPLKLDAEEFWESCEDDPFEERQDRFRAFVADVDKKRGVALIVTPVAGQGYLVELATGKAKKVGLWLGEPATAVRMFGKSYAALSASKMMHGPLSDRPGTKDNRFRATSAVAVGEVLFVTWNVAGARFDKAKEFSETRVTSIWFDTKGTPREWITHFLPMAEARLVTQDERLWAYDGAHAYELCGLSEAMRWLDTRIRKKPDDTPALPG